MSTTDEAPVTLTFGPPGGHSWTRDRDHQDRPRSHAMRAMFERSFAAGFRDVFARYGIPLAEGRTVHVHGWAYSRMVPAVGPDKPGSTSPPAAVMKVLTRLHPALRRRERSAQRAIASVLWRQDADQWADVERAVWEDELLARQSIDLVSLDDVALATHVEEAARRGEDLLRRHFELVGPALGVARLLAVGAAWGVAPVAMIAALRGASPASVATQPVLHALAAELDARGAMPATLEELRQVSPAAAGLVDGYLARFGWRVLTDDLLSSTVAEQPSLLLDAVCAVRAGQADAGGRGRDDAVGRLRRSVPAAEQEHFDRLLVDARRCYSVLDDNSGLVTWGLGLMRRAYLEAGRRLADRHALVHAAHVFQVETTELVDMLSGGGPGVAEILARQRDMDAASIQAAPDELGPVAGPPPDPSVFPPAMATLTGWMGLYLSLRFSTASQGTSGALLIDGRRIATGHGVGNGSVTGEAYVARDADDAVARIEPGQILVCPYTTPAYNVVFPIVAGVVTRAGGPLGHTAVMAREFGFPAVVGIGEVGVPDGATITLEVDELDGP